MTRYLWYLAAPMLALAAALLAVACGSQSTTSSPGPTPTPTEANPVVSLRWEMRTTCGGTHNGVPVPTDLVPPPYDLPYHGANEPQWCLRLLEKGVPERCNIGGEITADHFFYYWGSTTWKLSGYATYPPYDSRELPRGNDEAGLLDIQLSLNPNDAYTFTARMAWSCGDARAGEVILPVAVTIGPINNASRPWNGEVGNVH